MITLRTNIRRKDAYRFMASYNILNNNAPGNPFMGSDANRYVMPSLSWIRIYHNVQDVSYDTHWHTSIEVILPYVNSYGANINGVDNIIEAGDIFIIPPGELHRLSAPEEGERLIMLFDYSLLSALPGINSLIDSLHPFMHISKSESPEISKILRDVLREIEFEFFHDNVYRDATIYYMLVKFLTTLGRANIETMTPFPNLPESRQHEYVNRFMGVCNHIDGHFTEDLPIEKLCEITGMTRNSFSKYFEAFTGMNYNDYLNQKRIGFAEKLLVFPDISTTDIAMKCGYNSLSTFNRAFRAIKKCSPTEYRSYSSPNPTEVQ